MNVKRVFIRNISSLAVIIYLILQTGTASAQPEVLSADQWAADIDEMAAAIREHHPNPFTHVGAAMFDDRVSALKDRVAALSDKRIIVEMAKIVALLEDRHTRLSIPRQHNELMFSFSHSTPRPPAHGTLKFTALPLEFRVFGERLYIVRAEAARNDLIGAEVLVALDIVDDPDPVTLGIRRHRPGADRYRRRL